MSRRPIYNPGQLSPSELARTFVVRTAELAILERQLVDFASGRGRQHMYVAGRRGMGKTMLLLRLSHLCAEQNELRSLIPAPLLEEHYGIGDLADVWRETIRVVAPRLADSSIDVAADTLWTELNARPERLAEGLFALLRERVHAAGCKLVLLVDNIEDIFSAIGEPSQHRFRELLQENPDVLLVAASPHTTSVTNDYGAAFYEAFRVLRLRPLTLDGARDLLVSDTDPEEQARLTRLLAQHPIRLNGIYQLTGGNPRLVAIGRRLLRDTPLAAVHDDLESLLDELTPYYKHLIDDIPRQQQRVFNAVAGHWTPVRAADIQVELRLKRNQVGAQLSRLTKEGWLVEVEAPGRGQTYEVAERLFNLFYVMRFRRIERERLRDWTRFVEVLFDAGSGNRTVEPVVSEPSVPALYDGLDHPDDLTQTGLSSLLVAEHSDSLPSRIAQAQAQVANGRLDDATVSVAHVVSSLTSDHIGTYGVAALGLVVDVAVLVSPTTAFDVMQATPIPEFWASVTVALQVLSTGDERLYGTVPREVRDLARIVADRITSRL